MIPRRSIFSLLLALAATCVCVAFDSLQPQQPPAPPLPRQEDPRVRIRSRVELVVVPVTVKSNSGDLVHDLAREEFRIFEDGVEQDISLFSADPFPLSAVVLIDNGLETKAAEQVQKSAGSIAAGFSEFDEVLPARFDGFVEHLGEFSKDNDALHDRLKRIELSRTIPGHGSGPMTSGPRINSAPVTGTGVPQNPSRQERISKNIDDAIRTAGELLRDRGRDRRKIILIISDGMNSRNNTSSFDETVKLLLSSDVTVYAIGVGQANLNRMRNVLARYARATGGDIFYAAKRDRLENLYTRVTEQARNQYTLAYAPRNTEKSREYHEIEVRIRRPDLTLHARSGYFRIAAP